MDAISDNLIAYFGILVLVIAAYRDAFGDAHVQFTDAIIKALRVPSRYKPLANMATSVTVALLVGGVLALSAGWEVLPVAALVGLFASARAATIHDAANEAKPPKTDGTDGAPLAHRFLPRDQ